MCIYLRCVLVSMLTSKVNTEKIVRTIARERIAFSDSKANNKIWPTQVSNLPTNFFKQSPNSKPITLRTKSKQSLNKFMKKLKNGSKSFTLDFYVMWPTWESGTLPPGCGRVLVIHILFFFILFFYYFINLDVTMQATHFGVKIPPLNSRNTTKEKSQATKFNELNRKKNKSS